MTVHFVPCDHEEKCNNCSRKIKLDELMMPERVTVSGYGHTMRIRVVYCHECGLLRLENK